MKLGRHISSSLRPITSVVTFTVLLFLGSASVIEAQSREGRKGVSSMRSIVNLSSIATANGAIAAVSTELEREPIHRPMPLSERHPDRDLRTNALNDFFGVNRPDYYSPHEAASLSLSPSAVTVFNGLGDDDTSIPPDTNGAVGPSHLMLMLNSQVSVQDRTGLQITIAGLQNFWSSLSKPLAFDPRVLYDPLGARWMASAGADSGKPSSGVLVGVSQSGDPTGNWNLYRINVDPTGQMWGDYPMLGFNKDWIIVDVNLFSIADNSYKQTNIYVLNKADLYAHGSGPYTLLTNDSEALPAVVYDNSMAGSFLLTDYNGNSGGSGYLGLYTITGAVGAEKLSPVTLISTPDPWGQDAPGGQDFLSQLGSTNKIQTVDSRIQSLVYRNGSLWSVQSVVLPAAAPTHTAVQWWQLTPSGGIIQRGRIEDVSGLTSYTCPSLAVNKSNDLLIGYSRFAATQYVSANYSFRAGTDALGTMRGDIAYKNGEAPYHKLFGGTENRWGDYSSSVVDPINDLDMWTLQESAGTPLSGSDRWGVWWARIASIVPASDFSINLSSTDQSIPAGNSAVLRLETSVLRGTPQNLNLAVSGVPPDATATFTPQQIQSGNAATLTITTTPFLTPGTYSLTISATGVETRSVMFNLTIVAPTKNPIDDPQTFVTQHYLDFLSRQPDVDGLAFWTSKISSCGTDLACVKNQRVAVSAAFFIELEFQQTGSYVYRMYKGTLGRQPSYNEFTNDRANVVGGPALSASKSAFAEAWVQRPGFLAKYPSTLTPTQFVDGLIQTVKAVDGTDVLSQRTTLINELNTGSTKGQVASQVIEAAAFVNAEYNPSFVLMQYFGYLKRDPDPGGYDFWLNVLNNRDPDNFHGMVCSFLTSAEYQLRFGPVVTRSNAECGN